MKKIDMTKTLALLLTVFSPFSVLWAQNHFRLSLSDCREMALQHSEELQQADNKLLQAAADQHVAKDAYLPRLDASVTGAYIFPDMDMLGMELRMRGTYMAGINLTQPLYAGGKIKAGKRMARIGADVAYEQKRMTRMKVLSETDKAYWTLMAINNKVQLLVAYKNQMDSLYQQVMTAVQAGFSTDDALLRIEAERSKILYQLQKARGGANLCRLSLCRILGKDPETQIDLRDTLDCVVAPVDSAVGVEGRPELRLLNHQVDLAGEQVRMSKADILPTVGLMAGYTYYGNIKLKGSVETAQGIMPYTEEFRDGLGAVMLSVKVPLFQWGAGLQKIKKARLEVENARLEADKNRRLLELDVQQALQQLKDGYQLVLSAEAALKHAEENLRVTANRYKVSMAVLSDLLDAQTRKQQAESDLIEAKAQYKINETNYKYSIGCL